MITVGSDVVYTRAGGDNLTATVVGRTHCGGKLHVSYSKPKRWGGSTEVIEWVESETCLPILTLTDGRDETLTLDGLFSDAAAAGASVSLFQYERGRDFQFTLKLPGEGEVEGRNIDPVHALKEALAKLQAII